VLSKRFVPKAIPLEREPLPEELDSIACFQLLLHSEIETYLEERISDVVKHALDYWKRRHSLNQCGFHLLLRWYNVSPGVATEEPHSFDDITALLEKHYEKSRDVVAQNHGIKKTSFTTLTALAGFPSDHFSGSLLPSLDSFGTRRGDVAHRPVARVRTLNDPLSEAEDASQLVKLLLQFDVEVEAVLSPKDSLPAEPWP
jgi:hypothetical protein